MADNKKDKSTQDKDLAFAGATVNLAFFTDNLNDADFEKKVENVATLIDGKSSGK